MSYCRKNSESDVYVYEGGSGLVCHECTLWGEVGFPDDLTRKEMWAHLQGHIGHGDKVPAVAIDRLELEIKNNGKLHSNW